MPSRRKIHERNARAGKHDSAFLYMEHDAGRSTCSAFDDEPLLDISEIVGTAAEHNDLYATRSARWTKMKATHIASESSRKDQPIHNVVAGTTVYSSHMVSESSCKDTPIRNVEAGTLHRAATTLPM